MRDELVRRLGRVGIWSGEVTRLSASATTLVVRDIQKMGFSALWYPEAAAKEPLALAAVLLAQSRDLVVATGIATIWVRDAMATANAARTLAEAYPRRFVLGLGVGHAPLIEARGHTYSRPFDAMRRYLDEVASAAFIGAEPPEPAPVVLGALGPRMLTLAGTRCVGAHTYLVPVAHTAHARTLIGPDAFLAVEQAVVLSTDPDNARALARRHVGFYLGLAHQRANLLRLGFAESDLADGGSERLIDALVAWGTADAIQRRVIAHLDAGADHVAVQVLPDRTERYPIDDLRSVAPALREL
jgi:probable F420-dependent oxidoreductase